MDIAARGYANPDLLWSPETLREQLGNPDLVIIDTPVSYTHLTLPTTPYV